MLAQVVGYGRPASRTSSVHARPGSSPCPPSAIRPATGACRTGRDEFAAFHAECAALLDQATALDDAQRALSVELADVRTKLAEMRIVMWPRVEPKDIVHGFRLTHRGGPPPIPPIAPERAPLEGKHLRSTVLAILARNGRPMTLVEIHRELHLNGYAIASRHPVKRLADALGYET